MSRRYAPDHKKLILRILHDYQGNVFATALYADIPVRTLNHWVREERLKMAERSRTAAEPRSAVAGQQLPP